MSDLAVRQMREDDRDSVVALWDRSGISRSWNDPDKDIAFALRGPHSTILLAELSDDVIGMVMVGEDGHRGWFYYMAVDPAYRNQGIGRMLMMAAERWLVGRGVWKCQLLVRDDNLSAREFYERLGYQDARVVSLQKIIGDA